MFLDVEATGRKGDYHDIVQLSGIFCGEEFDFKMKPVHLDRIEPEALKVQGRTLEEVMSFPDSKESFEKFIALCDKHIDKYNKSDRATIFAYNAIFDFEFVWQWFSNNSPVKKDGFREHNIGGYFVKVPLCVMQMFRLAVEMDLYPMPENFKLGTVCAYFNIPINAHDALSDARATKALYEILVDKFK